MLGRLRSVVPPFVAVENPDPFMPFVADRNSLRGFQVNLSCSPHYFANKYDALDLTLIRMPIRLKVRCLGVLRAWFPSESSAIGTKAFQSLMIRTPGVMRHAAGHSFATGVRSLALPASSRKLGQHATRNDPPIGPSEDGTAEQSSPSLDRCSSDLAPYRRCIDHRQALSPLDRRSRRVVLLQRAPGETG